MIEGGAANDSGTPPAAERGGMDDIVRRLDALLRTVAEAPSPATVPAPTSSGNLEAARRERESRRLRGRLFGAAVIEDCAWDIMLELFIAREEGRQVSLALIHRVTGRSEPVLLRSLATLIEDRLILRTASAPDPRDVSLALSEAAMGRLCDYFSQAR